MEYEVKLPKDVAVTAGPKGFEVKGKLGHLKREMDLSTIKCEKKDDKMVLATEVKGVRAKEYLGTAAAHMRNMVEGVTKGYTYRLKVVYAHFPINVSVDGKRVVIKNFAGEKMPRYADIVGSTKVDAKGQDVTVTGIDLEEVSQTAANIEQRSRTRRKDIRVFQDGIYITAKGE